MTLRKQTLVPGEFYHLYNRGTDKRIIFQDKKDYEYFLSLMYACNTTKRIELRSSTKNFDRGETLVDIGAYCLMPNHFHILIYEKTDSGVSKYMLKLLTGYTMYFNKRYKRTGKLYEGVFKSVHVDTDRYFKYMYSYIHLNPAKLIDKKWKENKNRKVNNLLTYIFSYPYSSIKEYVEANFKTLNIKPFPPYFKKIDDHKKELFSWLRLEK